MKKTLITFLTILFCLTSSVGWSADFEKGIKTPQPNHTNDNFITNVKFNL